MAKAKIVKTIHEVVDEWRDAYLMLGFSQARDITVEKIYIPQMPIGFEKAFLRLPNISAQKTFDRIGEKFDCWKWDPDSLDDVLVSDLDGCNYPRIIWMRDRVEADKELKNFSADETKQMGISGISLGDRFLLEFKRFLETRGKHLDVRDNVTICSGSRHRFVKELVPYAYLHNGFFFYDWILSRSHREDLRVRQVIA